MQATMRFTGLAALLLAFTVACAPSQPTVVHGNGSTPQPVRQPGYAQSGPAGRASTADTSALDDRMRELAGHIVRHLPAESRRTVAVADFVTLDGETSVFGRYVAEELMITLLETGRVTLVERSLLQNALDELHLNATDIVDPENARQLGRVVGADCVATGTVTDRGADVKVNARLIDTEKSTVLSGGSVVVRKSSFRAIEGGEVNGGSPSAHDGGSTVYPGGKEPGGPYTGPAVYVDGYESPAAAWAALLNGLATNNGELVLTAVRPQDRYLITHLTLPAFATAMATMSPALQGIHYNSASVATASLILGDGTYQEAYFERHGSRWFVVLDDEDYDPNAGW